MWYRAVIPPDCFGGLGEGPLLRAFELYELPLQAGGLWIWPSESYSTSGSCDCASDCFVICLWN